MLEWKILDFWYLVKFTFFFQAIIFCNHYFSPPNTYGKRKGSGARSVTGAVLLNNGHIIFRRVFFDVAMEGQPFIRGLPSLDKAISTFLSLCFVLHLEFPPVRK
jgi:hypothetical protein